MYNLYNILMHIVHIVIIGFSMFGFLFTDFLLFYLILQFLILCSWLGYGLLKNQWGRCIVTHIQWNIKNTKDIRPSTESYIQYWLYNKLGFKVKESVSDLWVFIIFGSTSALGILRYLYIVP